MGKGKDAYMVPCTDPEPYSMSIVAPVLVKDDEEDESNVVLISSHPVWQSDDASLV